MNTVASESVHFAEEDTEEDEENDREPDSICSAADPNLEAEQLMDIDSAPESATSSKSIPTSSTVVSSVSGPKSMAPALQAATPAPKSASSAPKMMIPTPETPKTPQTPLETTPKQKPRGKAATPHPKAFQKTSVSLINLASKPKKYPCPFSYCDQRPYSTERDLEMHLKNYHKQKGPEEEDVMVVDFSAPSSSTGRKWATLKKKDYQRFKLSKTLRPQQPALLLLKRVRPSSSSTRSQSRCSSPLQILRTIQDGGVIEDTDSDSEHLEAPEAPKIPGGAPEPMEVIDAPVGHVEDVQIVEQIQNSDVEDRGAYEMFPFVYEPREEPPEFVFSVGEMARKLIGELNQKNRRIVPRPNGSASYCIACLDYRTPSGTCQRRHDSNDDRIQKFWMEEFPHEETVLSREIVMQDLEEISTNWE